MDCKNCKETHNVGVEPIPYIVHEGSMARAERRERRLVTAIIVAIVLLFLSNAIWLWAWMQYDYVSTETTTTYTQDGEGLNIIGDSNEVTPNGTEQNG